MRHALLPALRHAPIPTLFALVALVTSSTHAADAAPAKWEPAIAKFEQQDRERPPAPGGVVFVGSSSIVRWKLNDSFPDKGYLNRGFGGSQMSDSVHFAERIVTPYQPRVVVVYAGDNDLASGKSPETVARDFRALVQKVHARAPAARIVFLSIKASLKRWANAEKIRDANARIARFIARDSRLAYVDTFDCMLDDQGQPRAELLDKDELHLSPAGYELWTRQLAPQLAAALDETPDLVLHNGKIATVDARFSIASAVAIRGDRLVRVGSSEEILALRGPKTQTVDLAGRLVLPGLIDSHVHPSSASMHEFDHPVPDMESIADVLAYVKSRVAAVPEGQWIWVNQIFITRLKEQRYPTRAELDAVAPKHPVVFSTGPDGMANSLALQLSGIDKNFVVTGAGLIEKDATTGELTGMLRGGTKRFLKSQSPPSRATTKDRDDRLLLLLKDYNSVGLTTIADRDAGADAIDRYARLLSENRLTTRIAVSHSVNATAPLAEVQSKIREIARHPLRDGGPMLRIVGTKSYLDGGMLTGSAFMRQPWGVSSIYGITDPEYRGVRFIPPEQLLPIVRTTVEEGLQYTAHSVGDGAVHALLDAYEEVNREIPVAPTRPCLTHSNFMSREAAEQMRRLGVVADIQPAWLFLDSRTLNAQFGYDRLRYFQPLKTLFELGVVAGGGSDHMQKVGSLRAINPYNPFLGMWTTLTRRGKWFDGQLHPEEALSREQAIRFYTINNAYVTFLEDQVGSLEPGKLADLIVLDRDLLTCPVDEVREARVLTTYLSGRVVHSQDAR